MARFVCLTPPEKGMTVFVNLDNVAMMRRIANWTAITFLGSDQPLINVAEKPEEILAMAEDS